MVNMKFFRKFVSKIISLNKLNTKVFRIYSHPENGLVAIKKGPSFSALILNFIWLFYKKLYLYGVIFVVFLISILLNFSKIFNYPLYIQFLFWTVLFFLYLITAFFIFIKGNDILVKKNIKNGYKFVKIVEANNAKIAINLSKNIQVGWTSWQDLNTLKK
tara:strand:- start:72 stop:551 length:480 start_codon:yes stop_codon:yes gene_type:complete